METIFMTTNSPSFLGLKDGGGQLQIYATGSAQQSLRLILDPMSALKLTN